MIEMKKAQQVTIPILHTAISCKHEHYVLSFNIFVTRKISNNKCGTQHSRNVSLHYDNAKSNKLNFISLEKTNQSLNDKIL